MTEVKFYSNFPQGRMNFNVPNEEMCNIYNVLLNDQINDLFNIFKKEENVYGNPLHNHHFHISISNKDIEKEYTNKMTAHLFECNKGQIPCFTIGSNYSFGPESKCYIYFRYEMNNDKIMLKLYTDENGNSSESDKTNFFRMITHFVFCNKDIKSNNLKVGFDIYIEGKFSQEIIQKEYSEYIQDIVSKNSSKFNIIKGIEPFLMILIPGKSFSLNLNNENESMSPKLHNTLQNIVSFISSCGLESLQIHLIHHSISETFINQIETFFKNSERVIYTISNFDKDNTKYVFGEPTNSMLCFDYNLQIKDEIINDVTLEFMVYINSDGTVEQNVKERFISQFVHFVKINDPNRVNLNLKPIIKGCDSNAKNNVMEWFMAEFKSQTGMV